MVVSLYHRRMAMEVSSPKKEFYKYYQKEDGTITLYMSIWMYAELMVARQLIYTNCTVSQLKSNFAVVGGSCRLALTKQHRNALHDVKNIVETAVSNSQITSTFSAEGKPGKEESVSDILMHHMVTDEVQCNKAIYDYASGYIVAQLQKEHSAQLKAYFESIITESEGRRGGIYFGTLAGRFFEDYAIRKLCEGGKFAVKKVSLPGNRSKSIQFPALTYPDDVMDIVDEQVDIQALPVNKIGQPVNVSFPAIDALCTGGTVAGVPNDMFFQMKNADPTSSSAKKIRLPHLNRLHGYMANQPVRLYQVVPDFNFASATPLKYYNADGTVGVAPPVAQVEEWCLSIETSGLTESARKKMKLQ